MKKFFKKIINRNDGTKLLLYSTNEHSAKYTKDLGGTKESIPHLRWHPLRQEWISYSAGREKRTFFPPDEYCPLCPSTDLKFPTEIPFNNFEVAVFPNRWPSFRTHNENIININNLVTKPANGKCEVIVYSPNHNSTISDMTLDQIKLLVYAWNDRYIELLEKNSVKYVMPFENRGEQCGVTLHHPHGQIYSYPFVPPVVEKEIIAFKEKNYLLEIMSNLEKKYYVYQDEHFIAAVPPFARYAYEVWIIPKKQLPGPWEFSEEQLKSFSICLQSVVKGYDDFLGKKCPYLMGLHAAPHLNDKTFHFHVEFYPPLRSGDKPKILAGSESLAGVFIMDVLPEETALILREHMNK